MDGGGALARPDEAAAISEPLRLGQSVVRVGTCSWTDPTLVKQTNWYPKRTMSAAERLSFYATQFCVVEVDSTYYRPANPDHVAAWSQRVPPGFIFDVKAFGLFTGHPVEVAALWPDIRDELGPDRREAKRAYAYDLPGDALEEAWERFLHSLSPLDETGHLGAVLFQYPPWFVPKRANRDELARLVSRLGAWRGCVELRSPKWFGDDERERTLALLKELGLAYVVVDAPAASGLPALVTATSPELAVVRFHGRSDATWSARGISAAERFRYLYSPQELEQWVPRARELADSAGEVHLLMNNCYQDYGARNAAQLANLLSQLPSSYPS